MHKETDPVASSIVPAVIAPLEEAEERRAVVNICDRAADAAEAKFVLEALGLDVQRLFPRVAAEPSR